MIRCWNLKLSTLGVVRELHMEYGLDDAKSYSWCEV